MFNLHFPGRLFTNRQIYNSSIYLLHIASMDASQMSSSSTLLFLLLIIFVSAFSLEAHAKSFNYLQQQEDGEDERGTTRNKREIDESYGKVSHVSKLSFLSCVFTLFLLGVSLKPNLDRK